MLTIKECVAETNRIEGIDRPPTAAEIEAHENLMCISTMSIGALINFLKAYQPDAVLRERRGLNVVVGNYRPPNGGPHIRTKLQAIIDRANIATEDDAWRLHVEFERLHPFTDGNGRSGRALWYWIMRNRPTVSLGFLHAFYYQTLRQADRAD